MKVATYVKAFAKWDELMKTKNAAHDLSDHMEKLGWRFDTLVPYVEEGDLDRFSIIKDSGLRVIARITFEGLHTGRTLKVEYTMNVETMGNLWDIERTCTIVQEIKELMRRISSMKVTDFPSVDD